jgi:hypothetical protein
MSYGLDDRPWYEKWWLVLDDLEVIERLYRRELRLPSTQSYRAMAARFCSDCWDMRDWLRHDEGRVPDADRKRVARWVESTTHIAYAGDVANTFKNRTRAEGRTAGVVIVSPDVGEVVTLGRQAPDERADLRALARGATAEWRQFLTDAGLSDPYA